MLLQSVQVGQPRTTGSPDAADPFDRPMTSAIWKEPVHGPVRVDLLGLDGDAVVDRKHHGGPHQAVLAYPSEHYAAWRMAWGRRDVGPGGFGENLTLQGVTESTACLGDLLEIGDVILEVSAPRTPCQTLARRHGVRDLVQAVRATHRHGWYLRVRRAGLLEAGQPVRLLDRPYPQWTVARAAAVRWQMAERPAEAALLAACPALSPGWRERLAAAAAD